MMLVRLAAATPRAFAVRRGVAIGRSNAVPGRLLRGDPLGFARPVDVTFDAMCRAAFGRFFLTRGMALAVGHFFG